MKTLTDFRKTEENDVDPPRGDTNRLNCKYP